MTSKSSSKTKFKPYSVWHECTRLLKEKIFLCAALWVFFLIAYPVMTIIGIMNVNAMYEGMENITLGLLIRDRAATVQHSIGLQMAWWPLILMIAIIVAIIGYYYLFRPEQIDFYDSQPMPRMKRFCAINVSGLVMFVVPYVVNVLLALAAAKAMGAMQQGMTLEILYQGLRMIAAYFGTYEIAVLAVMLTGNYATATLGTAYLLFVGTVSRYVWEGYCNRFFKTYAYADGPKAMLSPFYNLFSMERFLGQNFGYGALSTGAGMQYILKEGVQRDLATIVAGVLAYIAARMLFQKRKAEYAGCSVIHRPVRLIVKITGGCIVGLFAGYLLTDGVPTKQTNWHSAMDLAMILTATVITCGLIQCIYQRNPRKFFEHSWQIVLTGLLATLVYLGFATDVTGYDRYIPKEADIESAALYSFNDDGQNIPLVQSSDLIGSVDTSRYVKSNMKLTDIAAIHELAQIGMQAKRDENDYNGQTGWEAELTYRLKNGRNVTRRILIPYDTNEKLLNALIGSKEYKEVINPVYNLAESDAMSEFMANATLSYQNGFGEATKSKSAALFADFAKVYQKEYEAKYNFTLAHDETAIGVLSLSGNGGNYYYDFDLVIYPSYKETIAFLKANDLYEAPVTADQVTGFEVQYYGGDEMQSVVYNDPAQIEEILAHSIPAQLPTPWKDSNFLDYDFNVSLTGGVYGTFNFRSGEVPAFVEKDLGIR